MFLVWLLLVSSLKVFCEDNYKEVYWFSKISVLILSIHCTSDFKGDTSLFIYKQNKILVSFEATKKVEITFRVLSFVCKKAPSKTFKLCVTSRNTLSYMKWYSSLKIESKG